MFTELPERGNYVVAMDEEDTELGDKSYVEFRDANGNVLKTTSLGGGKYRWGNTSARFRTKPKAKPVTPPAAKENTAAKEPVRADNTAKESSTREKGSKAPAAKAGKTSKTKEPVVMPSDSTASAKAARPAKTGKAPKAKDSAAVAAKAPRETERHPHEQLATADKLDFRMNFKYNVTEIDVNDEPFKDYIANILELYNKNGAVKIMIVSSASTVPTRAYGGSNKKLAIARAEHGKEQLLAALKEKGVDESRVTFISVKSYVNGPQYNIDYLLNKDKYEQYQYIKLKAY